MDKLQLTFNITSPWHIGSGEEGGAYADALVLKNTHNLPYLPGRSVKGLLRHAFQSAQDNNWFDTPDSTLNLTALLFGTEGEHLASQGMVQISNAQLSPNEVQYFVANKAAIKSLYQVQQSTAIDANTGTAKQGSLRSLEVAVPMDLSCEITLDTAHPHYNELKKLPLLQWLANAAKLITHIGHKRTRGLGSVLIHCDIT